MEIKVLKQDKRKEPEKSLKATHLDIKMIEKALNIRAKYTSKQIINLSNIIAGAVNPEKIILFGSYAYGKPTYKSDVDLMVVMKDKTISVEDEVKALLSINEKRIKSQKKWINSDIIIVSQEDINARKDDESSAIFDALRKGKIIYGSNVQKSRII